MNALVWACLCEISINVNQLFIVYYVYVFPCRFVVACSFVYPLFYTALCCCLLISFTEKLLLYFYLFINHVNKPIISVFEAFVYHFKNTISIFVTLLYPEIISVNKMENNYTVVHESYMNCTFKSWPWF